MDEKQKDEQQQPEARSAWQQASSMPKEGSIAIREGSVTMAQRQDGQWGVLIRGGSVYVGP